jgi:hypothetical protein
VNYSRTLIVKLVVLFSPTELTSGLPAEEELVPSIEEISNELMSEIQNIVAKDNTMTWL